MVSPLGGLALAAALAGSAGHPMHTSVTELRSGAGGAVHITIRLYADDLAGALGPAGAAPPAVRR